MKLLPKHSYKRESNFTQQQQLLSEIMNLEQNPNKQVELDSKKQQLNELISKKNKSDTTNTKPSNKTALYIGLGAIGLFTLFIIIVLAKNRQKKGKLKH